MVKETRVFEQFSGGTQTIAGIAQINGKKQFLRSNVIGGDEAKAHAFHMNRWALLEAEILMHALSERVGVLCPRAEMVELSSKSKLHSLLGRHVLSVDFIDEAWAGGEVLSGRLPKKDLDVDAFAKLLLLDILIGNGDRRHANFFVTQRPTGLVPIAIDNNCGFMTLLTNIVVTSHTNFLKTYDGIEGAPLATGMKPYGSIAAILEQSALANMLEDVNMRARVIALVPHVVSLLDDAFIEKLVDALPAQIIPASVLVEEQNWMKNVPEATRNFMLDGQTYPLSGAALFEARKKELKETLKWRRDHLNDALTQHIAQSSEIHPVGS